MLRAIFNHGVWLLVIHHTPLSIEFAMSRMAMQGCNAGLGTKPALSHERSHYRNHNPSSAHPAQLSACRSSALRLRNHDGGRAGRTGSILPPDRSDVMPCIVYLQLCTGPAFAVALRCVALPFPLLFPRALHVPGRCIGPSTPPDPRSRHTWSRRTNSARRSSPQTTSSAPPSSPCMPSCTPRTKRARPTRSSCSASRPTTTSASRIRDLASQIPPPPLSLLSCLFPRLAHKAFIQRTTQSLVKV